MIPTAKTWGEAIREYSRLTGKSLQEVVKEQAGYLLDDLFRLTPPTSATGVFREAGGSQRKRGEKVISGNMTRQFLKASEMHVSKSDSQIGAAMRKYSSEGDHQKLGTIINRISRKTVRLITEATEGLHDSRRNPRTGKPTKERFVVLDEPSVEQTIAGVQKRVGYGKSGWLQAFASLGRKVPAGFGWVRGASKQAGGYALIVNSLTTPSVTVANAAPHGANLLKMKSGDNLCERAVRMRATKMFERLAYMLREPKVKTA